MVGSARCADRTPQRGVLIESVSNWKLLLAITLVLLKPMKTQSISRRQFIKTSAAAAAGFTVATPANLFAAGEYGGNKIPFALQLYSVRNECAKDLVGTVTAVAKMGYKAVEFAGYHGRDARTLRPAPGRRAAAAFRP